MEAHSGKQTTVTKVNIETVHDRMIIIAITANIKALRGKFAKQILTRLEADGTMQTSVRKHVLDGLNDYAREVEELLNSLFY